ncbi:nucleotide sugar dehydrogenase [Microvirga sp. W0021]|uniref:Nucleotide sugar dehydrogenase n=1 Tax=Hohaiivirga grylli TaxID=3133970 RepID=A0ABV0BHT4_9HYPH
MSSSRLDSAPKPALADQLVTSIEERKFTIGVIGLGYVGLPLSLAGVSAGFKVIGFDINEERVAGLNRGEPMIRHLPEGAVARAVANGLFRATSSFNALAEVDAIIICVPTPLTKHGTPDLSYIRNTTEEIARHLKAGQLIVLESTTYPGTTTEVVKPILEHTGLKCGQDFLLAFSPEREDPGNIDFSTTRIPKVVGGEGPDALRVANALYGALIDKTVPVSSTATAEAVKLTENIFRAVNIALVNELKGVYDAMGIDIWEVIEAAKTKPFGFMPFYPGPGLGGHCIPIDPFYLSWKAKEYDTPARFIELAGEINTRMPYKVVERLAESLDRRFGEGLKDARILLVGLAYKKNVDDIRESPALKLMELLEERGARVDFYDPYVSEIPATREYGHFKNRKSVALSEAALGSYSAVLIVTDHDIINYAQIADNSRLIIDTRNACHKAGIISDKVVKA